MSKAVCFICGKQHPESDMIPSYFIPTDVCKDFGICRVNSANNKIHICKSCNSRKRSRILFPPMHAGLDKSYVPAEYAEQLKRIQVLFYKLCVAVTTENVKLHDDLDFATDEDSANKSPYWKRWLHDYKRIGTKTENNSVFDRTKVFIGSNLRSVKGN